MPQDQAILGQGTAVGGPYLLVIHDARPDLRGLVAGSALHAKGTLKARTTHPRRPAKAACEKRRDSLGFRAGGGTVMKQKLFNIISLSLWVSILKTRPHAALGEMKPGILNNQSQETVSHLDTTGGVS